MLELFWQEDGVWGGAEWMNEEQESCSNGWCVVGPQVMCPSGGMRTRKRKEEQMLIPQRRVCRNWDRRTLTY